MWNSDEEEDEDDDEQDDEDDDEFDTPMAGRDARLQAAVARRERLQQFCWLLLMGGTILIAGSWADALAPELGWVGFGIAAAGMTFSMLLTGSAHPKRDHSSEEWD